MRRPSHLLIVLCVVAAWVRLSAQSGPNVPTARLVSAPRLVMPGAIDSNVPMAWDLVDGEWRLFAMASWGGAPVLLAGPALDRMGRVGAVTIRPHPGDGVWIESVIPDVDGTWYGYYHHEVAGTVCNRPDRAVVRVGAAKSHDRGSTWEDLGVVLESPPESLACDSNNRFVLGGVGDLTAILDHARQDLYLFVSQYAKERSVQGVAVARLAWADRDAPSGRVMVWRNGVWLPPTHPSTDEAIPRSWSYPAGTPLVAVTKPWHDGNAAADAFWGPSVHWNTYLERYVMLLNRAKDEQFSNEGLYVSFAPTLDSPRAWSAPQKVRQGGGWYPQVVGLEGRGTDKEAGRRARFFVTGRSEAYIEFQR